ncbi:hypothetical protein ACFTWF_40265 [Rhodococcus sp. NPDC056960]|uniref:hypothetical protein n=1 Tax=Rhodococcus sp. NPDC056960 TaxID=3345982 RepID=UPI00362A7685
MGRQYDPHVRAQIEVCLDVFAGFCDGQTTSAASCPLHYCCIHPYEPFLPVRASLAGPGGVVERIDWVAEYEPDSGYVFLLSDVTVLGQGSSGLGMSGSAAQVDDEEEPVVVCIADLVQDQVARAPVAWPRCDTGGFMTSRLVDAVAVWFDNGCQRVIGSL